MAAVDAIRFGDRYLKLEKMLGKMIYRQGGYKGLGCRFTIISLLFIIQAYYRYLYLKHI
jgi:hypothetical protein